MEDLEETKQNDEILLPVHEALQFCAHGRRAFASLKKGHIK
jgi:hypothetical protein